MRIGVLKTLVTLGATLFWSSVVSASECLDYEPAKIIIQGSISLMPAYGPPGFGEDPKNDAREDYLALTLDAPVCMKASSEPHTDDISETEIKAMQLVFRNDEAFKQARQWIGSQISVTGSLFHGFTGHHHTTVLLKVKEIGQAVKSR
jgi:Domain of unknown function (DUF4431)